MFETPVQQALIRALTALKVMDDMTYRVWELVLEERHRDDIMKLLNIPRATFYFKYEKGKEFLLEFLNMEALPFKIDHKFPRIS